MKLKELSEKSKRHLTIFVIVLSLISIAANFKYRKMYNTTAERTVMRTDSEGYYQYLPHFFIFDWDRMDKMHWAKQYGEGKTLNIYTCGVAIMQTPFFLITHATSYFFELDTEGYSPQYFLSVFFASLFYVLLGLLLLYKFLRRFINHNSALWSIILLFFATNLFYYTTIAPGMSHAYSFSLVAIFIYFTPIFYEKPNFRNLLFVAFPLALATLIRPTNLLIAIFLFLYGIHNWSDFKERFNFWLKRWYFLVVMLLAGILMFVPQMLYWHAVTGKYIFYSYQDEGTFPYWLSPQIYTVLIGPRNGWLLYTPLMIFSVSGLIYLVYKRKLSALAISIIMVLIIYINSSWWRPTFSGAAGYRALIGYLPFMAIPLGFVIHKINSRNNLILKTVLISIFLLFIVYNIRFSYIYNSGVWWNEEWTWYNFERLIKF